MLSGDQRKSTLRASVCSDAPEQDRVHDGDADRDGRADAGDRVQPVRERLPGRIQQRRAELAGQMPAGRDRSGERLSGISCHGAGIPAGSVPATWLR
jgi:hypothetical protein